MKFLVSPAVLGILISLASLPSAIIGKPDSKDDRKTPEKIERSTVVDPRATITLCVMSGEITVRGWEKNEVRVSSTDADRLDFQRVDKAKEKEKESASPPSRIDVMVFDKSDGTGAKGDCRAIADVEMDVPRGATIQVQTRDGDIRISGVAAAYAGSQNGDIEIERAVKLVEAGSVGGSISLKDSSGRINLSSAGGGVEASNVRSLDPEDTFEVGTVSGDIQLNHVNHPKLTAKTVNGTINMTGPLASKGRYAFTTMTGDLNLYMPPDASFQLNAKFSDNREIVSDFPLRPFTETSAQAAPKVAPTPPKTPTVKAGEAKSGPVVAPITVKPPVVAPYVLRRVSLMCGSGDALISVASFGGTIRLKKM